jgi:hypothetical protein
LFGNHCAKSGSFQTYSKDGKSYLLLKVYGENAFMREIINDKSHSEVVYFNVRDMTGMTLKKGN